MPVCVPYATQLVFMSASRNVTAPVNGSEGSRVKVKRWAVPGYVAYGWAIATDAKSRRPAAAMALRMGGILAELEMVVKTKLESAKGAQKDNGEKSVGNTHSDGGCTLVRKMPRSPLLMSNETLNAGVLNSLHVLFAGYRNTNNGRHRYESAIRVCSVSQTELKEMETKGPRHEPGGRSVGCWDAKAETP